MNAQRTVAFHLQLDSWSLAGLRIQASQGWVFRMRGYAVMKSKYQVVSAVAAVLVSAASPALADMGKAPVSEGAYGLIEGGFLYQDGGDVIGHGISPVAGTTIDVLVSPDSGWFAGGLIGFANRDAFIAGLPFRRFEIYGLFGRTDDDARHTSPPLTGTSLKNVDASVLVGDGATGTTSSERRTFEGGIRFEGDDVINSTTSMTWIVSPFIRWSNEETGTLVTQCCDLRRSGDVDTTMYGILIAAEPEVWLTDGVAFVGRVGVGIYGFDADGNFSSSDNLNGFFASQLSDSDSGFGFRGQLGAGLKFRLSPTANLETFAEADYFTDVGTALMANNQPGDGTVSRTGTTDLWELRAGARVTIGFGNN
jgi:hypothetical protein